METAQIATIPNPETITENREGFYRILTSRERECLNGLIETFEQYPLGFTGKIYMSASLQDPNLGIILVNILSLSDTTENTESYVNYVGRLYRVKYGDTTANHHRPPHIVIASNIRKRSKNEGEFIWEQDYSRITEIY